MPTLIDSYSESNQDNTQPVSAYHNEWRGQSFTNSSAMTLDSAKFYLKKSGSPTGSGYVKIYAHTGTYGGLGKPTGAALATSGAFDVSTLTTSYQLITFNFSGAERITLSASTYYCVVFYYAGGGETDFVQLGDDGSSPSHSGSENYSTDGTNWTGNNENDACFYVYGEPIVEGFKSEIIII